MSIPRFIATLLLSFSVALVGVPVQAVQGAMKDCPVMKMQQEAAKQNMEKHDCCPKAEKQQSQKKFGCCDDAACNIKCSTSSMNVPTLSKGDLPQLARQTQRLYIIDATLASHILNSQERPPKLLS